ncbi:RNA polymerase factor sigma-54 [Dasania sp. GY-MA-18]|uniref:RNA polymerase sigma-54 factor n=1 Tax=Dasania phycosphaerae TaxID=2950436 RepID=A0A9J6RHS2_9GAMM|nr:MULTISPECIES: RNA polymerase factor sigma-54 [Dasania]MCR8921568.1 RNA polymerase factor sigma-54 [Dasania sp. GY-MA-18]MCZ0863996.1 RNA polymerase factor sigma-54 [Dasania phycosphaerae]MCZ0867724.1 RNA polymerase factor sigma-54 [Dasania phycosphaerae]
MKQSLQLKIGQQLTMTPQLQQAIKLLQLSTLDLQQEIQQALESNPMLEVNEESENETAPKEDDKQAELVDLSQPSEKTNSKEADSAAADADSDWAENNIPDDLPVDTNWDDVYTNNSPNTSSAPAGDSDYNFDANNSAEESLQDHLYWQLNLTRLSDLDRSVAMAIVDAIDTNGRLTLSPEDILSGFSEEHPELELDEVMAVLHRVQQFDPPGVAAADLQECLLIQLNQLSPDTPWLKEAKLVITRHLALLGNRDYAQLMRRSKLKEPQLQAVLMLIQSLNPNPGETFTSSQTEYIVPDVFVKKIKGRWTVELNPDTAPKLSINNTYASMVKRADNSSDNNYLRDNLQEARWFLKSLQSRNETLMKVATRIVEHQRGFLDYGDEAMKPLVLHDIAEAVEMHESTISRVTTQKYMHTPRGIFELKYFFSSHVSTDTGGECSSTAIRALIKKLIAAENTKKPLSDSKITALLGEQGIKVARRTIAKYRESLNIPPSNERKRLI